MKKTRLADRFMQFVMTTFTLLSAILLACGIWQGEWWGGLGLVLLMTSSIGMIGYNEQMQEELG